MSNYEINGLKTVLIDRENRADIISSIETVMAFVADCGISPDEYVFKDELKRIALRFRIGCSERDDTIINCAIFYYAAGVWDICMSFKTPRFFLDLPAGHSTAADSIVMKYKGMGFYIFYNSLMTEGKGSFTWNISKKMSMKKATASHLNTIFKYIERACAEIIREAECSFWNTFNASLLDNPVMKDELWDLMQVKIGVYQTFKESAAELSMEAVGEIENQDITIAVSEGKAVIETSVYFLDFEPCKGKSILERHDKSHIKVSGDMDGQITLMPGPLEAWLYEESEQRRSKRSYNNDHSFVAVSDSDGTIRFFRIKKYDRYQKMADVVPYKNEYRTLSSNQNMILKCIVNTEELFSRYYGIFVAVSYLISSDW